MKNILITLVLLFNLLPGAERNFKLSKSQLFHLEVTTIANETSLGSAVALDGEGKLVTAYHVIDDAVSIKAVDSDGREFIASIGKVSQKDDLAYLYIKTQDNAFAEISKNDPKWSENIYALSGDGVLLKGIISKQESYNNIVINFEVPRGMSGGGLFNQKGELLGIISHTSVNQGISYATSVKKLDHITEKFTQQKAIDFNTNNYNYSYCTDKSTIQTWEKLIKADTIEVHELHALFLGLCEKVKRKDITTEVADYLFLKHRDNLINSQK